MRITMNHEDVIDRSRGDIEAAPLSYVAFFAEHIAIICRSLYIATTSIRRSCVPS